ncbi:bifunctional NAD(P)H-dependent oxidoreductase/GNAT family N-acetyltransferase [Actinacidiphila bryophytorum]|uniref:bifunctional NAD(P)H-dependent oxidoreductase/GNAT family N-acetyltransferase n=1 Tax=Actinacidiphila bryophytorum TaxID=1436133 RepID=UPI002176D693|nr:bifunctional NAD(P)H-dependent oxidoreductase/GNAT family N-acetyltransferase [Actinacidiphila bryophytorum]UWE13320.1 bifunctional NAD(P)H-dependent oxidoreductase/GNAT family N-acetyltransferase [Actinacidiphila bryophytorum]
MSTKRPLILVLVCSTRPGALGPAVGSWLAGAITPRARELGVDLMPLALGDLGLPFLDEEEHPSTGIYRHEHTRRWSATVAAADGFVVVTPEYNYGMPATLKNALDYLGPEWAWKPVGFVSYGNTSAGTRAVQHAKQVVTTLRLVPVGATVALRIADAVHDGQVRRDDALAAAAVGVLDELVRVAQALRPMRERAAADTAAGPLPGSYVRPLTLADAPEVTVLQRCCWVEEALANDTLAVPALHEPLDEVRAGLAAWQATGLFLDGRLLAMVRTRRDGDDWHVGRLAVAPDLRGQGLGRWMLRTAESAAGGCGRLVLTTGAASRRNIALYESEGYRPIPGGDPGTTRLAKTLPAPVL